MNDYNSFKYFLNRETALNSLLRSCAIATDLQFLGISHRKLCSYLRKVIDDSDGTLPWQTISVYYAVSDFGELWEGHQFSHNLRQSRRQIADLLTNPKFKTKLINLREVHFRQAKRATGYTGAFLRLPGPPPRRKVYYVLNPVSGRGRTEENLTFQLQAVVDPQGIRDSASHQVERDLNWLDENSDDLLTITPSMWNLSTQEWHAYCTCSSNSAYAHALKKLIDFTVFGKGHTFLEVGSGTGILLARMLLKHGQSIDSFVALESSPQMLSASERYIGEKCPQLARKITFALGNAGVLKQESKADVDFVQCGKKAIFNTIILHNMLPTLAPDRKSLESLVRWCDTYSCDGAQIILSARNTFLSNINGEDENINAWRERILGEAKRRHYPINTSYQSPTKHTMGEIVAAYEKHHRFSNEPLHDEFLWYPHQLEERMRMWLCPAILNTVLDVSAGGIDSGKAIVHAVAAYFSEHGPVMPPTGTKFWKFIKR